VVHEVTPAQDVLQVLHEVTAAQDVLQVVHEVTPAQDVVQQHSPPQVRTSQSRRKQEPLGLSCPGCTSLICLDNCPVESIRADVLFKQQKSLLWCQKHKLLPMKCPHCDGNLHANQRPGSEAFALFCGRAGCRKSASGKTGEQDLRLPDVLLFLARIVEGVKICKISRDMSRCVDTVRTWLYKTMENCALFNVYDMLSSLHTAKHVQADETFLSQRKYERGRRVRESGPITVCGLVVVEDRRVPALPAQNPGDEARRVVRRRSRTITGHSFVCGSKSAKDVLPLIEFIAIPGATVETDGAAAYTQLAQRGFAWTWVNHSEQYVASDGTHTNNVEKYWCDVKMELRRLTAHLPHRKDGVALWWQLGAFNVNARLEGLDLLAAHVLLLKWRFDFEKELGFEEFCKFAMAWAGAEETTRK